MDIKDGYPPNIDQIRITLPVDKGTPIFTYGNTIYNPHKVEITPDLQVHEQVHADQQGDYPDVWWYRYLSDPEFRLDQEIEAYGVQYAFARKHVTQTKLLTWVLDKMAQALSSELYGSIIGYGEARSKIRNYAKYEESK